MASGNSGQPSGTGEPINSPNRARSSLSACNNGTLAATSLTCPFNDMRNLQSGGRGSQRLGDEINRPARERSPRRHQGGQPGGDWKVVGEPEVVNRRWPKAALRSLAQTHSGTPVQGTRRNGRCRGDVVRRSSGRRRSNRSGHKPRQSRLTRPVRATSQRCPARDSARTSTVRRHARSPGRCPAQERRPREPPAR
jgi:hypothetical protein